MKKLRAVTLIELLVVMLVSTIVIGICYYSYLIAHTQLGEYKKINRSINEAKVLNSLLKKDFIQAKQIQKSDDGILFTFEKEKQHHYRFGAQEIIRTRETISDTFKMQAVTINYLFQSEKQEKNNMLIDEITFEAKVLDKVGQFHYVKEYDAETLMSILKD